MCSMCVSVQFSNNSKTFPSPIKKVYCDTNVVVHCKYFCTDIRVIIAVYLMISTTELTAIFNTMMLLLLIEKESDFFKLFKYNQIFEEVALRKISSGQIAL